MQSSGLRAQQRKQARLREVRWRDGTGADVRQRERPVQRQVRSRGADVMRCLGAAAGLKVRCQLSSASTRGAHAHAHAYAGCSTAQLAAICAISAAGEVG